jgi:hypothetical protein
VSTNGFASKLIFWNALERFPSFEVRNRVGGARDDFSGIPQLYLSQASEERNRVKV